MAVRSKLTLMTFALVLLCGPAILSGQEDDTKPLWNNKLRWNVPAGYYSGSLAHDIEYAVYEEGSRTITSQWGIVLAARNFKECSGCDVVPYEASQALYKKQSVGDSYFPVSVEGDVFKKYWRDPFPVLWVLDANLDDRNWNDGVLDRNDYPDPNISADQLVTGTANSSIGLSVTQNAYIWTNPEFEDFIIVEYILTNTGNYDADATIENEDNQLHEVYIGLQSVSQVSSLGQLVVPDSRGILQGNDDWVDYYGEQPGDSLKVIYAWDGDAAITFASEYDEADPLAFTGQPLSPQYLGRALLYAQTSPTDLTNDTNQPVTTHFGHWGSEGDLIVRTGTVEGDSSVHGKLSSGNYIQEPFEPTAWAAGEEDAYSDAYATDKYLKTATLAFGPYEFTEVGQSIRIVTCLAVGSISFERAIQLGQSPGPGSGKYLQEIRSGRDSLFAAVSRAKRAFYDRQTGIWDFSLGKGSTIDRNIKDPLPAPSVHYDSESGHVRISWQDVSQEPDHDTGSPDWAGYRVYRRAAPQFDLNNPTADVLGMIYESESGDTTTHYEDYDVTVGRSYWYMVTAFDQDGIESHRFLNRAIPGGTGRETDQSAGPLMPPADTLQQVVIVPNPYHTRAVELYELRLNELKFFNLPWACRVMIYSQTGDLLKTIEKEPGASNYVLWNQYTDAGQRIVSGLYIVVVDQAEDKHGQPLEGGPVMGKFVIIR